MNVRPATPGDNPALLDVARTLWLPGLVRFGVDLAPDFFALHRMESGESLTVVGEDGGEVVGFLDGCIVAARAGNRPVKALHICLAGMRVEHRGKSKFQPMIGELEQRARALGCEAAFGLTDLHNARVREFVASWPHGAIFSERIKFHVILGDPRPERASPVGIRRATAADLPRIDSLVQEQKKAYDFAPSLPGGMAGIPGLQPSDFMVAAGKDGEIVACLALWDQAAWRRTPLVSYGIPMQMLRPAVNAAFAMSGRPQLPRVGDCFRFCHLAFPAAAPGEVPAFAALLRAAVRELRQRGLHFVALGLPEFDPLAPALRGFFKLSMTATPFVAPGNQQVAADLEKNGTLRAWLDYALM